MLGHQLDILKKLYVQTLAENDIRKGARLRPEYLWLSAHYTGETITPVMDGLYIWSHAPAAIAKIKARPLLVTNLAKNSDTKHLKNAQMKYRIGFRNTMNSTGLLSSNLTYMRFSMISQKLIFMCQGKPKMSGSEIVTKDGC